MREVFLVPLNLPWLAGRASSSTRFHSWLRQVYQSALASPFLVRFDRFLDLVGQALVHSHVLGLVTESHS